MNDLRSQHALALLVACCACNTSLASGAPPAAKDDAGVAGGAVVVGGTGGPGASALEDATFDRRVFRHVLVGMIHYPSERITWVMYRSATRARLEIFCQVGQRVPDGISLDGKERDESYWLPPVTARYVGAKVADHPLTYRVAGESIPSNDATWGDWPSSLRVECRPERVSVLRGDAILIPGAELKDNSHAPGRWQPSSRQTVAGLRCQILRDGAEVNWRVYAASYDSPLVFAPAGEFTPGVEWAYENSDMVVQQGAYRLILPPR